MKDKRVWLVTGASRGIGLAVARRVIAAGDRVAILARGDAVHATADELGDNCLACQADVSCLDEVGGAIDSIISHWGRLDVVVNNAGLHRGGKLARLEAEDWHAVLNTNLTGTTLETMVRSDKWKLVHFMGEEAGQLFDLENDPKELKNLWDDPAYAEAKKHMHDVLHHWYFESRYNTRNIFQDAR